MSVNEKLDKLENLVAESWRIPIMRGKSAISTKEAQNLIDDIRLALPTEIKQSKIIVEDRNNILQTAREEAKNIVRTAKKHAQNIISETAIIKEAKKQAATMLLQAQQKTAEMHQKTNAYVENIIENLEKLVNTTARNVRTSSNEIKQIIKRNTHKT